MKKIATALVFMATLAKAQAANDLWTPDARAISAVEKAVARLHQSPSLPPLASYSRFYMGVFENGRQMISGILLQPQWETEFKREGGKIVSSDQLPAGSHIVTERRNFPAFPDGGCSAQEFFLYDVAIDGIVEARCNGIQPVVPVMPPLAGSLHQPLPDPVIPPSIPVSK